MLAGQKVTVKFDAFPSPVSARSTASGRRLARRQQGHKLGDLSCARPDAADIDIEGKRVAIAPGMAVSAEIITGVDG